jgi:RIO-like serine/threonine protein kinase
MAGLTALGPYSIVDQIGQGGFATVYLGSDEEGNTVAIKQFATEHGTDVDKEKAANERACLERLGDHPHILSLRDVVEDDNGVEALVLEYCEGGDLIKRMVRRESGGQTEERDAFSIWKQIIEGVKYMHSAGVVHLDLKPQVPRARLLLLRLAPPPTARVIRMSQSPTRPPVWSPRSVRMSHVWPHLTISVSDPL